MDNRLDRQSFLKLVYSAMAVVLFLYFGVTKMGTEDFGAVMKWWFALLVLGLAVQPLAVSLFSRFHDLGWVPAKALGIALAGWLMWFLSSCHILKFSRLGCVLTLLVVFAGCYVFYELMIHKKHRDRPIWTVYSMDKLSSIVAAEAVFFCLFVTWCYIKGFNPDAYGTERFMDFSYMKSLDRTAYMPAKDVWLSGNGINYYYVGQYMATFVNKIAGVGVERGYNIAMMSLAVFGFCVPYSLGNNIMRVFIRDRKVKIDVMSEKERRRLCAMGSITEESGKPFFRPALAGLISGLAISVAGNMHFPIYKYLYPKIQRMNGDTDVYSYWFPDATRFIGYMPDVDDKTIHEFPIYSYVVGDLHAHVINTIFVLTLLCVLFAWLLKRKDAMDGVRLGMAEVDTTPISVKSLLPEVFQPELIAAAFFVGLFHTTNYWDFPIYFVVCGAVILFSNLVLYAPKKAFVLTALQAVMFIALGELICLPFTLSFDSISSSIGITSRHTSLYQLLVLWGLPVFCVIGLLLSLLNEQKQLAVKGKAKKKNWLIRFLTNLSTTDLFVLTMGLCAIGLVLLPEIIFVQDIYGGAYERSNTMFKLTYQAFLMFGLSMGYILIKYVTMPVSRQGKALGLTALVCFGLTLGYVNEALEAWFFGGSRIYDTLDATTFIADDCNGADAEMIDYINENIKEQSVILEMCGVSYTYFNRISTFTGMETVLGWRTHEWLWRSSGNHEYPAVVSERHADVLKIYTSTDAEEVKRLIEKYDIDYIYIGECEQVDGYNEQSKDSGKYVQGGYYGSINVNVDLLLSLGTVEKMIPASNGRNYATYLIRINK